MTKLEEINFEIDTRKETIRRGNNLLHLPKLEVKRFIGVCLCVPLKLSASRIEGIKAKTTIVEGPDIDYISLIIKYGGYGCQEMQSADKDKKAIQDFARKIGYEDRIVIDPPAQGMFEALVSARFAIYKPARISLSL